jgi:hypothetical protein
MLFSLLGVDGRVRAKENSTHTEHRSINAVGREDGDAIIKREIETERERERER